MDRSRSASLPVWLLAALACIVALKLGAAVLGPILLALVTGVVVAPLARQIDRLGVPRALSALLTLLIMLLVILAIFAALEPVLDEAIRRAPLIWNELREIVVSVKSALRGLDEVSAEVAGALSDEGAGANSAAATTPGAPPPDAPAAGAGKGEFAVPTINDALILAPGFLSAVMIFVGTLYFFLLSRQEVYDWISASPSVPLETEDMLEAEREVSRYFLTITLINGTFGLLVAGALYLLGMPYAPIWGFAAFLVNFILYVGPVAFGLALLLAGLVVFDGPYSFAPAAVYLLMNATEGQFVTPDLVGRQMAVNPLMVFVSLVGWLWLWGPVGGLIAIPLLVWVMVLVKRGHAARAGSLGGPVTVRPNLRVGADG